MFFKIPKCMYLQTENMKKLKLTKELMEQMHNIRTQLEKEDYKAIIITIIK